MNAYSVIVEYETVAGREAEFCALMGEHARLTLEEEPGCLRFELLRPTGEDGALLPRRFITSALYANQSALATHRRSARRKRVLAAMDPLTASRRLTVSRSVFPTATDDGLRPEELNAANDG
ncbi:antibiotic biosynthesis monooxygenase [Nitratireductor sp. CAU 1489]|uniref:Antibiotic biosynthesis monooxygenase n=1 Tax=Nitratireductor arenosus TaxID=2682096 RepID=A0A844QIA5_9HYPH|nr:antibiotic biosynthesis monooxygenase [Nitratireductor arenosus]